MKIVVRGSEFSEPPVVASDAVALDFAKKDRWQTFGFRLVHDDATRTVRGAPWRMPDPSNLRAPTRPQSSGPSVGFRLSRRST